jgi:hypothetical protein
MQNASQVFLVNVAVVQVPMLQQETMGTQHCSEEVSHNNSSSILTATASLKQ